MLLIFFENVCMENIYTPYIGKVVQVIIDRPLGSEHPKHGFKYDANYGYVPDTKAEDEEEIDVYVLGVDTPLDKFSGKCIAVIHRENDNEDKLVVVPPEAEGMSDEEILSATHFQEQYFKSVVVRE